MEVGDRIVAIQSANEREVRMLGRGRYVGEVRIKGRVTPRFVLDNGQTVLGYDDCWFGPEAKLAEFVDGRRIINVKNPNAKR